MSQLRRKVKGRDTRIWEDLTPDRRRVLAVLLERSPPVTERELAAALARRPDEERDAETIHCRLRHVDLPKLADVGLVRWDPDGATVRPGAHPALEDERFRRAIEAPDRWDVAVGPGASERRHTILALLEDQKGVKDRSALAYEVAICAYGRSISEERIEEIETSLHHVHLPALDHAGFLAYDADDGTVMPAQ
jgi:hypothetical protein